MLIPYYDITVNWLRNQVVYYINAIKYLLNMLKSMTNDFDLSTAKE